MESKSKPLPHGFKSRSVLVAIFDMIVALDFPWQKSNNDLTGKGVFGIHSSCGNDHCFVIFGSNFSYTTWGKIPFTNKPLRTLKNIYKIDHEYD